MAQRILCASFLAWSAFGSVAPPAAAQYPFAPPPVPTGSPNASPALGPAAAAGGFEARRPAEQLWYGGQGAYAPSPAPGAAPIPPPAAPPASATPAQDGFTPYRGPASAAMTPARLSSPYGAPPPAPYVPSSPSPNSPALGSGYPANLGPGYAPGAAAPRNAPPNAPPASGMPPAAYIPVLPPTSAPPAQMARLPESLQATMPVPPALHPAAPVPAGELFEAGQVVAIVGDDYILAGDLLPQVNQWIEANRDKIPPGREEYYRRRLMEQVLQGEIQNKLIYLDFLRQVRSKGAGQDKITQIHHRVYEQFDEKRLPDLMEKAKVASPVELDAKLREQGSSLLKHKRQFAQKVMSQQWLQECNQVNYHPVITHAQMLDYYYEQADSYAFPAKARWEHLMVRFSKFPNKAAAWEAIRAMGQEVYLGGTPLWAVAKRSSHGVTASDGGQFDWTTQGSLKSKVLDQAIFSLEPNKLSPILEDDEGFHIVRVLERKEAGRTSFETAQSEIKEKLKKEEINKQIETYLADLRKKTYVWTIFDEEKKQREQEASARAASGSGAVR